MSSSLGTSAAPNIEGATVVYCPLVPGRPRYCIPQETEVCEKRVNNRRPVGMGELLVYKQTIIWSHT